MLLSIKLLPVMACICMLATSDNVYSEIKSEMISQFGDVVGILQRLEAHVLRLEEKIECLANEVNGNHNCATTSTSGDQSNGSGTTPSTPTIPMDCLDVRNKRQEATIDSGLYMIGAPNLLKRRIYCNFTEQETWTTISRRVNEEDIFNRSWTEYKNGFGQATGDYWIGNEMLYQLTKRNNYYLRITMYGGLIGTKTSSYKSFKVRAEETDYELDLGEYDNKNSNGGDSFFPATAKCNKNGDSGAPFSTYDHGRSKGCSKELSGGWWFTNCGCSNLNGKYIRGWSVPTSGPNIGLYWDTLYRDHWNLKSSLRSAVMEIRRI